MESKYNIDNFERFLRDKTDEFRMYPSKRVWYSVYNNMHPGNRMPSISMCIILIFSLLLVGYLHTDTSNEMRKASTESIASNHSQNIDFSNPFTAQLLALSIDGSAVINENLNATSDIASSQNLYHKESPERRVANGNSGTSYKEQKVTANNQVFSRNNLTTANHDRNNTTNVFAASPNNRLSDATTVSNETGDQALSSTFTSGENAVSQLSRTPSNPAVQNKEATSNTTTRQQGSNEEEKQATLNAAFVNSNENKTSAIPDITGAIDNTGDAEVTTEAAPPVEKKDDADKTATANAKVVTLSETDKNWIEHYAMYNRAAPRKWKGKLAWQAYVTPSIVYRTLVNTAAGKDVGGGSGANINNANVDDVVKQKPSFGVETGIALQYSVLKFVKVKAGLQLNYTRYNTHAFENYHPIGTSLTMNSADNESAYDLYATTPFSNATGLSPVKLHNQTYQVSLPIGADVRLAAGGNLEWYVGATIQPTFVASAISYVISTDRRNYIHDPSLLNRFNLNAGFETYLSFKTNNYTWQVGPQFRSQIFSTNTKLYSVEERLQNFGFKIGISKKL